MMLVRAYLAPSSIEGLGVFCKDAIRRDDVVWRFDSRFDQILPRSLLDEVDERTRDFLDRYCYDLPEYPGCVGLDADECRFINHSETPNLAFCGADHAVALTDIPAGVELTCDYRAFQAHEIEMMPSRHQVGNVLDQKAPE